MDISKFIVWIVDNPIPSVIIVLTLIYFITLHSHIRDTMNYTWKILKILEEQNNTDEKSNKEE